MTSEEIHSQFLNGDQTVIDCLISLVDTEEELDVSLKLKNFSISRLGNHSVKPVYTIVVDLETESLQKLLTATEIVVFTTIYSNRLVGDFQDIKVTNSVELVTERSLQLQVFNIKPIASSKYLEDEFILSGIEESSPKTEVTIELFEINHLTADARLNNFVLKNATPMDAILLLLRQNEISLKFIAISKATNNQTYRDIFLPPSNLFEALNYIINTYGLHKNGTIVYYENGTLYITEKSKVLSFVDGKKSTEKFFVNVMFKTIDEVTEVEADSNIPLIEYFANYQIQNNTDSTLRNIGNNVTHYKENESSEGIYQKFSTREKYFLNPFLEVKPTLKNVYFGNYKVNSKYSLEASFQGSSSQMVSTTLTFVNTPLKFHNPMTQYIFNFTTEKDMRYNGIWIPQTTIFSFVKASSGYLTSISGVFNRISI